MTGRAAASIFLIWLVGLVLLVGANILGAPQWLIFALMASIPPVIADILV